MSNENETRLDYATFIADLEAKRAMLDSAIASLKAAAASGALGVVPGSIELSGLPAATSSPFHSGDIPAGAFLGKSIPEAARLYLATVKKKQTTKEIADALLEGGMETNAKNFEITVGTGLYRVSKKTGEFVRLKGGAWGLAEWYPSAMRASPEKRENRKGKSKKPKRKPRRPRESTEMPVAEKTESRAVEEGHHPAKLSERAIAFINKHPNEEFTAKQLSERFGIHIKVISMTMARPVKQGLIRMSAPGTYCAGTIKA